MITGEDLVVEQLHIAAFHPLRLRQEEIRFQGHAVEFRINAEDTADGFRPDPGTIERFDLPVDAGEGLRLRWDSAIRAGYRIPPHYDSMIGKLIVHGADRRTTLEGALGILERLRVEGVKTTIPLHQAILNHEQFLSGEYDVDFLARSGLVG
jgi:acetyl-CoA carboxylase biotin carboxylase subunit